MANWHPLPNLNVTHCSFWFGIVQPSRFHCSKSQNSCIAVPFNERISILDVTLLFLRSPRRVTSIENLVGRSSIHPSTSHDFMGNRFRVCRINVKISHDFHWYGSARVCLSEDFVQQLSFKSVRSGSSLARAYPQIWNNLQGLQAVPWQSIRQAAVQSERGENVSSVRNQPLQALQPSVGLRHQVSVGVVDSQVQKTNLNFAKILDWSKSRNVQSSFTHSQCVTRRCVEIILVQNLRRDVPGGNANRRIGARIFGLASPFTNVDNFPSYHHHCAIVYSMLFRRLIRYCFVVWVLNHRHLKTAAAHLELLKASYCSCFLSVVDGSFSSEVGDTELSTTCWCCRLDGDQNNLPPLSSLLRVQCFHSGGLTCSHHMTC